ncbi:MAG: chromosomal replication initiator protein DnaA [Alphaproteobacteria bacterium]|nr:chromosomal replication initiator protein DnaA [Alphaproteobacteria bacterium]
MAVMTPWVEAWQRIRVKLRGEFGDATFDSWLKPLSLLRAEADRILVAVPTRFMCDWVKTHYLGRIADHWRQETGVPIEVELVVNVQAAPSQVAVEAPRPAAPVPADDEADGDEAGDSYGAPLDPRFTFDSFVVGKSNELAHAAARRVACNPQVQFNPLFLYGGVGLGKTHLMHAIAAEIRARTPGRRVLYLSAEKFMYQFIRAIRFQDTMAFKEQFRSVDVLMIDDVQFIAHKDATQEEFFHTFNAVVDQRRQVVISGDRSPSDLEGIEDRIKSRLGWGLVADIHPTDYELRLGILHSKLDQVGCPDMPKEVVEFLARKIVSNVRELEGALNRVTAYADLVGRPVSLEMTQEVLQDLIRSNDRRVSISEIQRHVAEYFNVRLSDLLSARRARAVARPRQVAMYLAKQLTSRSLPEIGRKFGGRDHTTVMHAVRRIEELREVDSSLDQDIENLRRTLEN